MRLSIPFIGLAIGAVLASVLWFGVAAWGECRANNGFLFCAYVLLK